MRSLRSALIFIGTAGLVLLLLMLAVVFSSDHEENHALTAVLLALPTVSFITTGLFAWWRRPNNPCGPLMTAIGFAWTLVGLSLANSPVVFAIGNVISNLAWLLLGLLLLIFPSGRIESPRHKQLFYALVVCALVLPSLSMLFTGPEFNQTNCSDCPRNALAVTENETIADLLDNLASIVATILVTMLVVVIVRRYRRLSTANRAAIRPVLFAGSATLSSLVALIVVQALEAPDAIGDSIFIFAVLAMATVPITFLAGLLRARVSNADALGELILTLGDSGGGELDIREALASALGDESLEFAYWLPDLEYHVDSDGKRVELPAAGDKRHWTPVEHDGELIAAIIYDASLDEDRQLIKATGSAAALALRNQRLAAALRANVAELRASRARIVQSSDAARRTLERNLHDGAQQHLVSMALTLRLASDKLDDDPAAARELLNQASADLAEATTELRELARGIHPAILTDRGLGPALGALASRSAVPVELGDVPEDRLPPPVESAAYFVAAEALTNVARYAEASSAAITVTRENGRAAIEIRDDGVGGANADKGSGLRGLQDRVAALDGRLRIDSRPGSGTTIRAEFPCA